MTILDEADNLVDGDRQKTYGHPFDQFRRVDRAALAMELDTLPPGLFHPLYMILTKISRLIETPFHHDSVVDIAGFARTYEKVLERMER